MDPDSGHVALSALDYAVMALYMAALLGMGLYYRKFAQQDIESYFLAGRKLPGWLNGVSYAATCMNTDVAPAYCGMTVICGLFVYWWYISRFGLALMIGGILFALFWRRLKISTSPEFYELRFSGGPAVAMRTWISFRSAFVAVVAWTGSGLLGLHKVTHALVGWERWQTFAVAVPVVLIYVFMSGYMGVVVSDLIQTLVMIAASVILMTLVLADMGGPVGLYNQLTELFGTQVIQWYPPTDHEMLGIIGVIAWTVGTAIGYGGDVAPMAGAMEGQRLLSCRNSREATKMYIWTEIVLFFLLAILTLPALGAMVKWPGLYTGEINRELAYGMLLAEYLPPGILGIALIAMAASIMSTVDSNLNFGAQVILNDIYRRFIARTASLKHYLTVGRIVMFIIMGLAILVATRFENVIDISVFMLGLSSAELTANWAQWWWWRFNGKARLAASVGGPLIFVANKMLVFPYLTAHAAQFGIPEGFLSDYSMVLSSIALTTLLWIMTALLTRPDPEEKLVAFYRLARPLGWWGPIAEKAGGEPAGSTPIFRGMAIAITGTVMVAAGTISFCSLYVARWYVAAIAGITCATAGVVFKLTYGRFLRFLEQHAPHNDIGAGPLLSSEENRRSIS